MIIIYVLIAIVSVGHLDFSAIAANEDATLSLAANAFMGPTGGIMIAIAAMLATSLCYQRNLLRFGSADISDCQNGPVAQRTGKGFSWPTTRRNDSVRRSHADRG